MSSDDVIKTEKRHSSDIIIAATAMKNDGIAATMTKDEPPAQSQGGCCGNKRSDEEEERRLQQLKGELEMDEHEVGIEEIIARFVWTKTMRCLCAGQKTTKANRNGVLMQATSKG